MSTSQTSDIIEEEIAADVPLLVFPLDGWHRSKGGRMVAFAGYEMPIQYEGIMAEHLWTRENAGLFDVSHMGQLSFTGEGLEAALEAVIPASISTLPVGRQRYSLLLDVEGGILDDLMVARRPNDIYMVVNGATKYDDIAWLLDQLPDEITMNLMDDAALLAVQGPKAADALTRLVPGVEALFFMECAGFTWHGHALWISRSGYTGEDGFEISLPAEAAEEFADALCGQPEVKPIGLGARDSLRLEAGLPLYGHDLSPEIGALGADLGFAIPKRRREQGGFPGHERIVQDLASGAPIRRVGLAIEGRLPAREGAGIFAGNRQVGTVTSGGFGPSVGAPIAMGWVAASHAAIDTPLEIEVRGKRISARVAAMPFVPHHYYRRKS
ncbi:MAG: glycine cleavage system aminomethyltransferase GcvT [Sphingobium sp.]